MKKQKDIINIEQDFAAILTPGLELAFRDRVELPLTGRTFQGDQLTRPLPVCGPAAFIVLKALAFRNRVENKDAYDLFYVLRNYGNGPGDVAARLRPLTQEAIVRTALEYLREDFAELESPGPNRVALFLNAGEDDSLRAEVVGLVSRFLSEVEGQADGKSVPPPSQLD